MSAHTSSPAPLTIMIDGLCPLCKREGAMLLRMDRGRGLIKLLDITAPDFDASRFGLTFDQVMGSIHALTPQGTIVNGLEVFRLAYDRLGWGWLWAPTAWPVLKPIFDRLYRIFAYYRPRLSAAHRREACTTDRCRI
jgi:predicted DCC family thiol-disulfide oxidoreductase YuxK